MTDEIRHDRLVTASDERAGKPLPLASGETRAVEEQDGRAGPGSFEEEGRVHAQRFARIARASRGETPSQVATSHRS